MLYLKCDQSLVVIVVEDVVIVFILTNILIKEPVPVHQEPSSMISQDFIPILAYKLLTPFNVKAISELILMFLITLS